MKQIILSGLLIILVWGCSGSKETVEQTTETKEKEEVYVFEDVNQTPKVETPVVTEEPENKVIVNNEKHSELYFVQVGAYTSKSAADKFVKEAKSKLKYDLNIVFDGSKNLYVVQIEPAFQNKIDAENVRNALWKIPLFKDAWIREDIN
jgi:cell division protein FtsN